MVISDRNKYVMSLYGLDCKFSNIFVKRFENYTIMCIIDNDNIIHLSVHRVYFLNNKLVDLFFSIIVLNYMHSLELYLKNSGYKVKVGYAK